MSNISPNYKTWFEGLRVSYCPEFMNYIQAKFEETIPVGQVTSSILLAMAISQRIESDVSLGLEAAIDFQNFWNYQALHEKLSVVNAFLRKMAKAGIVEGNERYAVYRRVK